MSGESIAVSCEEKKIDQVLGELDQSGAPGGAVGIAIGGMPVYRKGFGLASIGQPTVLSPQTRMRIQSTTKHFTCLAYLLLCEEGKADVADRAGRYLPELHPTARDVTMLQLMGHTSGLRDVHDIRYQFSGMVREVPTEDLVSMYRDIDDVNFQPGTSWNYCNGGYGILTTAIERIEERPLEEVLWRRMFEPLEMHDTLLRRFDTDPVPNSAANHARTPSGEFARPCPVGALAGNGGIVSTVDDMLRWLAHMDSPRVGTARTWQMMKTPLVLKNGTSTNYGLGLVRRDYRGVATVFHAGGTVGSNSQMIKVPAAKLDIEIMLNRDDVSAAELAARIIDHCVPNLRPLRARSNAPIAQGTFSSPATGRVIQLLGRESRQYASIDGVDVALEPDDEDRLCPAGAVAIDKKCITLVGDRENPSKIRVDDFGDMHVLARLPASGQPDVQDIRGRYRSVTTDTDAQIVATDTGPRLCTEGCFGNAEFRLEFLAKGIWRARSTCVNWLGGILSFRADDAGFEYTTPRNRALRFQRGA